MILDRQLQPVEHRKKQNEHFGNPLGNYEANFKHNQDVIVVSMINEGVLASLVICLFLC